MWILIVSLRVLISGHAMTAIFMFLKALHSIFLPEGSILVISKATPTPDKEATILRSIIDSLLAIEKTSEFGDLSDEKTHREVRG